MIIENEHSKYTVTGITLGKKAYRMLVEEWQFEDIRIIEYADIKTTITVSVLESDTMEISLNIKPHAFTLPSGEKFNE